MGIGFLLFEKPDGSGHLISAQDLSDNLFRAQVGLVVLSACQTAALDREGDPMASVAGRLTATGIPAVLAMTHSVLAVTTQALFGRFYGSLAKGRGIASALDDARAWLANHPEKFEVRRGGERRMLKLDDWFLPALFHGGADVPLLAATTEAPPAADPQPIHNLRPAHEAGFFGRRRELWHIERWLTGETRRISITGFGGQGKTELALEGARWLLRTGPFRRAVFVDYAQVQSDDALGVAVSTIGNTLGQTLADAREADAALQAAPTLVILDNLETVPPAGLAELLDAASAWSAQGQTRLLLTSRRPDHGLPDYRGEGTRVHRRIALEGLGTAAYPDDALDWFAALSDLPGPQEVPPPKRDELIDLFDRVAFHPLSIAVLAQQLRTRSARQLGERLSALLTDGARSAIAREGTPASLMASLRLSLDRLSEDQRQAVGRLGVFQGGAFEDDLLAITGLGAGLPEGTERQPGLFAQFRAQFRGLRDRLAASLALAAPPKSDPWPALRRQLEAAALVEAERVPGVGPPFLRFHPTLAPLLWAGLDAEEQARLALSHRQRYYQLANYLYSSDRKSPDQARAIARLELPNLLHAVDLALGAGDPTAVGFVDSVNLFLRAFSRTREAAALNLRAEEAGGAVGSDAWFLAQSNRGEQLLGAEQAAEAAECFGAILQALGEVPSDLLAVTITRLGRCYADGGRPDLAEAQYRRAIEVTQTLEMDDAIKRLRGSLQTDLGDVLAAQGKLGEAKTAYEASIPINGELGDLRGEGVVSIQLGTLALSAGELTEAVRRYQEALELFRRLREPAMEAVVQHQLGRAFEEARQWEQAERHYRESAVLKERHGDQAGTARTWHQLARVCEESGRPEAAETWYRKAIEGVQASGNTANVAKALSNLAVLLHRQPGRLAEARRLAEEALAIDRTLDPGAAAIWKTYTLLAQIADQQSRPAEGAEYRQLARDAKRGFAGTAHDLKRHLPLILGTVLAVTHPGLAGPLDAALSKMEGQGLTQLVAAIRKLLSGERDADTLCGPLTIEASMIVEAILQALADPSTLKALLPDPEDGE